jgi:hypothetical protein
MSSKPPQLPHDAEQLKAWLVARVPALQEYVDRAPQEFLTDLDNEYAIFSHVVRPYLEHLNSRKESDALRHIWGLLEQLAGDGGPSVKNELFVGIMEDLDERGCFFEHMGPVLRNHWFEALTWFPERHDRTTLVNQHVDKVLYEKRWREEIDKVGGFAKLTTDEEVRICGVLHAEFGIEIPEVRRNDTA